jgi:hypothetical protein
MRTQPVRPELLCYFPFVAYCYCSLLWHIATAKVTGRVMPLLQNSGTVLYLKAGLTQKAILFR